MRNLIGRSDAIVALSWRNSISLLVGLGLTLGILASTVTGSAPGQQQAFGSPGEAIEALAAAVKAGDMDTLMKIFGPDGKQVLSSGDEVNDRNNRELYVLAYDEMHRLVKEPDGTVTLYVGAANWPFPIPLVQKDSAWYFDTRAGKQNLLYRRIGRNELATIEVCHVVVEAQREYASQPHDGEPASEYAMKLASDPGTQNGLYWKVTAGEPQSPLGPLVAEAAAEGYGGKRTGPRPFHGYLYKRLDSQGPAAPGGAKDYVVDAKRIGGFAFVAYPGEYRNSGVMTFIVNQDGIVYQKDLGPGTAKTAQSMTQFNPDKTWQPVQD